MIITKQIRRCIKPYLPKNFNKLIQEATGCSANTVTNVLHHEHNNYEVARALIILAHTHKQEMEDLENLARNLGNDPKGQSKN